jgi:ABC-type glycerol-3-phosphate transport system substrate-binding protein
VDKRTIDRISKRITRRDFLRLGGTAAGAALLAACGGPAATLTPTEAPAKPVGLSFKGNLDVWDWEFPVRETLVKKLLEEWKTKNPDIAVNYTPFPGRIWRPRFWP